LGLDAPLIRRPEELQTCDGLILPGGESTTFLKLLVKTGLFDTIQTYAETHAVFGTCAGLIMIAGSIINDSIRTMGLIDLVVERNAYGRQVDSFFDTVRVPLFDKPNFEGVFIRAPRIQSLGKETEAIGFHGDDVVMARNARVLVTTFHPELTTDLRIHKYFVDEFVSPST
jgi:5'-phosphate synthase pdxT subunit